MNETTFIGLTQNAALLLLIVFILDALVMRWNTGPVWLRQVTTGGLIGGIGVILMLSPWVLAPGIIFDTRSVLLGLSGLFFGAVPTLIAMGITAALRLVQGGGGAVTGVSVIMATGALGLLWRRLCRRPLEEMRFAELYGFGLVLHLVMLGLMFTLPWATALQVVTTIGLPVLLIYPLGTAFLGSLMVSHFQREHIAEQIRASENRFRIVADNTYDWELWLSPTGQFLYCSPSCQGLTGYTPRQFMQDATLLERSVHPDDRALFQQQQRSAALAKTQPAEFRFIRADDSICWVGHISGPVYSSTGEFLGTRSSIRDISEQKQSNEKLRQSELLLQRSQELANLGSFIWNIADDRLTWTRNLYILYGVNPDQSAGTLTAFQNQFIHPEDRDSVAAQTQAMLAARSAAGMEFRIIRPDGSQRMMRTAGELELDAQGQPLRWVGICQDITESRAAQQELNEKNALLENLSNMLPDIIYLYYPLRHQLVYMNHHLGEWLGYSQAELEQIGVDFFLKCTHPEDLPRAQQFREMIEKTPSNQEYVLEYRMQHQKGNWVWLYVREKVYQRDLAQNPEVSFGLCQDITTRKQAEAKMQAVQNELQGLLADTERSRRALLSVVEDQKEAEDHVHQLNAELEQRVADRTAQLELINHELESFSYSVSHDLRAPLRALDGFADLLLTDCAEQMNEIGRHYVTRIQEASQRMNQLINDLLTLSRVTRAEFNRQRVDLRELARDIFADLVGQVGQRQVEFEISGDLVVEGDAHLLRIALENLLNNAVKFTGRREKAHIWLGVQQQGGERVFFVRDNGAGFSMAYAERLFSPFQRLHGAKEFPGTGIGLVTVQRIVARHGGRIWPEAEVDQGACFYFTLGR